jgi:hypothetical protein
MKYCVCDVEERECMLRLCGQCPSLKDVEEIFNGLIPRPEYGEDDADSDDDFLEEEVQFKQWKSTDRTEMVTNICKRSDLVQIAARQMSQLIPHEYIANAQKEYLKKSKEDLQANKVIVVMDFSMNYSCLVQGSVQSYHWSPKQVTIHPSVIFYRNEMGEIKQRSIIFISDDLDHDVPLVDKFQEKIVKYVKENFPLVFEIEYVTDGCSAQYKSRGYFYNLCLHEKKYGMKATHTSFATSHGKNQCDADGGSIKRKARRASLQRVLENQIITAEDLFEFCQQEMSDKFHFIFVKRSEAQLARSLHSKVMDSLATVPGTRSFHHFQPLSGKCCISLITKMSSR